MGAHKPTLLRLKSMNLAKVQAKPQPAADGASFCPPHGAKAICGRRAKMEDAYTAIPFLLEVSPSSLCLTLHILYHAAQSEPQPDLSRGMHTIGWQHAHPFPPSSSPYLHTPIWGSQRSSGRHQLQTWILIINMISRAMRTISWQHATPSPHPLSPHTSIQGSHCSSRHH